MGALEVESTKPAGDTTLAHIIQLVGEAQSRRAPSEMWVERFARVYTPTVFAAAIAVALVPPLVFGGVVDRLDVPRARPPGHRLSLRARDFDAGDHRRGARVRGTERHSDQGRHLRRSAGTAPGDRAR